MQVNKKTKKQTSDIIAEKVAKILFPHIKRIMLEQAKLVVNNNKKNLRSIIKEELSRNTVSETFDDIDLELNDEDDETKLNENEVLLNRKRIKEKLSVNARRHYDNNGITGLIESAEIQNENVIEGADRSFVKSEKLYSASDVKDIKDVNPANIDFSQFVD